ncbi:Chalcone synthase [Rhynchospora pubera]|uniref:Chalcone synthase n=1 Tax=Rhynchospora pubera TaxID=906938 RepID=A0AAV8HM89_9POAL|nr:Chalcone synthase [Rhynchospora pubera]
MEQFVQSQRSKGLANVLAIGTALPPVCVPHDTYPDMYFRLTNSEHLTELKDKMTRICKSTTIKQRYMGMMANDGELLKKYPNIGDHDAPSLDARWEIVTEEVPKLAKEAAMVAIKEWGQPVSKITHLIFCTNSGAACPGGPKILKMVEEKLELEKDKFNMTRKVLSDVGNLSSPTVLFIMNEMRKKSVNEGKATTGDGLEFGMLLGFGPGLSIEAVVLRSVAI